MSNWLTRLFGGHCACQKGENCCQKGEKSCHDGDAHGHCCSHDEAEDMKADEVTSSNNIQAKGE